MMITIEAVKTFLLWSTLLHYGLVCLWFGIFVFAHDWLYRTHARWFRLSVETFDGLHYLGMSIYKIGIMLLSLIPLIVLCIVR